MEAAQAEILTSPPTGGAVEAIVGIWDVADPVNALTTEDLHWTSTNVAEAMPGVQTPLSWTIWSRTDDRAARENARAIGAISKTEAVVPKREADRYIRAFHGRPALQVEYMTMLGDRMPGTSGAEAAETIVGRVPEGIAFGPTKRRYPIVAWRLPATYLTYPRRLRAFTAEHDRWWRTVVPTVGDLDLPGVIALFAEAVRRFDNGVVFQTRGILSTMQPLFDALRRIVQRTGAGDLSRLSGASGGAEMAVIGDIWKASRGQIGVEDVTANHGFHGPDEGEISNRVWREDDSPVRNLVEQYAGRDESEDPALRDAERRDAQAAAERELLAAVPRLQRPPVRYLLKAARERLPMRGYAKRSFLQSFDVARACARRAGRLHAAAGRLDDPKDVFFLTAPELGDSFPANARELVEQRRRQRAEHEAFEMPASWTGVPEPLEEKAPQTSGQSLTGVGVSGGIVEGKARVVTDPAFGEVEPDEILVATTTDPSWSSIMFISSALVMDMGSAMSHAAVVARELDIPCVVNTQEGTRVIQTGDRVRVDGDAGTVEILA